MTLKCQKNPSWLPTICFVVLCLFLFAYSYGNYDFGAYYAGAKNIWDGDDPYASKDFNSKKYDRSTPRFIYPPPALLLVIPLIFLTFEMACLIWFFMSVGTVLLSFIIMMRIIEQPFPSPEIWRPLAVIWFLFFPIFDMLSLGQINFVILFCILVGIYYHETRPTIAGFFIVLGALIKIVPIVLFLFYLGRRHWPMVRSLLVMGILLLMINVVVFGLGTWITFLLALPGHSEYYLNENIISYGLASIFYQVIPHASLTTFIGISLSLIFVGCAIYLYRDKPLLEGAVVVAAISPWFSTIVWPHLLVLMLPMIIINYQNSNNLQKKKLIANLVLFEISVFILRYDVLWGDRYPQLLGIPVDFPLLSIPSLIVAALLVVNMISIIAFFAMEIKRTIGIKAETSVIHSSL